MRTKIARYLMTSLSALSLSILLLLATSDELRASETGNHWQGLYAGALIGGSYAAARAERGVGQDDRTFDDGEPVGGLFLGYNFETASPRWLVGIEADLTYADHNRIRSDQVLDNVQLRHKWTGSVRLRGGYVRGNDLLYGTVGWIRSDLEIEPENLGPHDAIRDGIILGLGGERAVGDHWAVRVEGLIAFYRDDDIRFAGVERTVKHRQASVRFGVGRRF